MQALWMLLGALAFSLMAVCVKFASAHFNPAETVLWRGLLGLLIIFAVARRQQVSLHTRLPGMHLWRSVAGVASLGGWFYAIAGLPLATAMTLNYMSSLWLAAFVMVAALVRPSRTRLPQGALATALLVGFAGVVLMLRPTIDQNQWVAGLVGLASGMVAAVAYLQVKALARAGEPELRTVFYFMAGTAVGGMLSLPFTGLSPWAGWHSAWLVPMAAFAVIGQWCMTRAYSAGATLVVANLQYSGIVFGALFSVLVFGDSIDGPGWLGMALIVASGIAATVLRARTETTTPPAEESCTQR